MKSPLSFDDCANREGPNTAASVSRWVLFGSIGMILYTYLAYPVLVIIASRLRSRPAPATAVDRPSVTVLISSHLEEDVIAEKIANTLASSYPTDRLQIVVAVDTEEDCTADIVRRHSDNGVELSYSPVRQGKSAAINRAMDLASGEIVVFSDANNLYDLAAIERLVRAFDDPNVGVATGAKVIAGGDGDLGDSESLYWRYEDAIKRGESRLSSCTGFAGEILAIRRELFEAIPSNILNDDFWIGMRIICRGYRAVYVPDARSFERVSINMAEERVRRARIVAGRYQAMSRPLDVLPLSNPITTWQIVSHKFLRPLVPVFMLAAAAANIHQVARKPSCGSSSSFTGGLQVLFYSAALAGRVIEPRNRYVRWALYLPTYLVSSNFAALDGALQLLSSKNLHRWKRVERRSGLQSQESGLNAR